MNKNNFIINFFLKRISLEIIFFLSVPLLFVNQYYSLSVNEGVAAKSAFLKCQESIGHIVNSHILNFSGTGTNLLAEVNITSTCYKDLKKIPLIKENSDILNSIKDIGTEVNTLLSFIKYEDSEGNPIKLSSAIKNINEVNGYIFEQLERVTLWNFNIYNMMNVIVLLFILGVIIFCFFNVTNRLNDELGKKRLEKKALKKVVDDYSGKSSTFQIIDEGLKISNLNNCRSLFNYYFNSFNINKNKSKENRIKNNVSVEKNNYSFKSTKICDYDSLFEKIKENNFKLVNIKSILKEIIGIYSAKNKINSKCIMLNVNADLQAWGDKEIYGQIFYMVIRKVFYCINKDCKENKITITSKEMADLIMLDINLADSNFSLNDDKFILNSKERMLNYGKDVETVSSLLEKVGGGLTIHTGRNGDKNTLEIKIILRANQYNNLAINTKIEDSFRI